MVPPIKKKYIYIYIYIIVYKMWTLCKRLGCIKTIVSPNYNRLYILNFLTFRSKMISNNFGPLPKNLQTGLKTQPKIFFLKVHPFVGSLSIDKQKRFQKTSNKCLYCEIPKIKPFGVPFRVGLEE